MQCLFRSFFQGGFECSTMRLPDGRQRDLLETTGHARAAAQDFQALAGLGIRTVRDGVRWHLIEQRPGVYDWASLLPQLQAATRCGTQIIWDLCHYGWPYHIDIWSPAFPQRFAHFAAAVAAVVRDYNGEIPFYCPVNEISFWAWAGGETACFGPCGTGRGDELKRQLARACLAAIQAIEQVDPRARFVLADPIIQVLPACDADREGAAHLTHSQFDAWDMIAGTRCPELGGSPRYVDIIGVNFYRYNQWYLNGPAIAPGEAAYTPMRHLLARVHERYRRPVLIAETGAEGERRAGWMRYVCDEAAAAMAAGVPIEGVCWYPVTDYPGWENDRHCPTGLLGNADATGRRPVDLPTAAELALQQRRFSQSEATAGPVVATASQA